MTIRTYNVETGEWAETTEAAPSFEAVLTPAEALAAWRSTAEISRAQFCINANAMGLLPDADAELAADGTWPQTFDGFIASLPLADRIRARADWADNPRIRRMAPTLLALATAAALTPEQMDQLCGWAG